MDKNIVVSILCITYNHENFIKQCLDGFVMQKTNFDFEIIIHDDASTDGTRKIIEEYVEKYPELFVPMFEEENQYSKGVQIIDDLMLPIAKGKYIALCEGDDYWCDENKLQMQYDFMESHQDCSGCFHNTINHDLTNKIKDFNFNNYTTIHFMNINDALNVSLVHTSSFFIRKEYAIKDNDCRKFWFGDDVRRTLCFTHGRLAVLPNIMSVYNNNNKNGLNYLNCYLNGIESFYNAYMQLIEYLQIFNKKTNNNYYKEIDNTINNIITSIIIYMKLNIIGDRICNRKNYYIINKELRKNEYYKKTIKQANLKLKIKMFLKYHCPYSIYKLIKKIKKSK